MERFKTIVQKVVAILTMFLIVMTQYVITGTAYAIDLIATQNENVQFRAYFKNGEEEVTEIESSIDAKDLKLKIDVAVKKQGYFNGQISLENAGFKFNQATANEYIREVKDNVIYLNQINEEETASIEVGIEYLDAESIALTSLREPSTVKLNGTYTSSGGTQTIDSGSNVKVSWRIPEGTKAELAAKIQTNSIYKVGEENKKIVQFLISSKLTNNSYPIKTTEIKATIPEGATKVEVQKRTTRATNGEKEFTAANYSIESNVLTIRVNNDEVDGKISWIKGVQDTYIVTYEYPADKELSTQNVTINETITTQDIDKSTGNNVTINAEQVQIGLNEEKDGIASVSKLEKESEIYKGKIYSGEARDFNSYTIVYVEYVDGIKNIEITENETKYTKEREENGIKTTEESNANVEIKSLKINKEKVASILGNEWKLTIGETEVDNNTEADENGNVIVQLAEGTKTITIKTSKPINNGSFVIETTKKILKSDYTREQLKEFTNIKDSSSIKYTKNNDDIFTFISSYNIGLKETESKASIQSEQQSLITSSEAQQLNMMVVLESSEEKKDLYKNPVIKIKLPSQVNNVSFSQIPQLMYANGLELKEGNYTIEDENGQKVINIKLTGEQVNYQGEAVQGTKLLVKTNVNIDKNAENSVEQIILNYTNENATIYSDNGVQSLNINIISVKEPEVSESDLKIHTSAKVGNEEIKNEDIVRAGEVINYTTTITNSGDGDAKNLILEVLIPENTKLIEINPKFPGWDNNNSQFSYTESYYNEINSNKVTKNNILIKKRETYSISYMVRVNKDISKSSNGQLNLSLKNGTKELGTEQFKHNFEPAKVFVEVTPLSREALLKLEDRYSYEYLIEVHNLTNEELKNLQVTINKNDAIKISGIDCSANQVRKDIEPENLTFYIECIPAKDIAYIHIEATIEPYSENLTHAIMTAAIRESNITYRTNILSEEIVGMKGEIKEIATAYSSDETLHVGDKIKYTITVKNTGNMDAEEINIEDKFSTYLELENITLNGKKCEYDKYIEENVQNEQDEENEENYNLISVNTKLKMGEEATLEITGVVDKEFSEIGSFEIINQSNMTYQGSVLAESEVMKHILKNDTYNGIENNSDDEEENNDEQENTDEEEIDEEEENEEEEEDDDDDDEKSSKLSISGTAWIDANGNGMRNNNETLLNGIKAHLFDIKQNKYIDETTTDKNGSYYFLNVENGQYVVLFEYDNEKYNLTKYQVKGISSNTNSDVEKATMKINGESRVVAATDTITISNNNAENIDIGLVETKMFDLSLKKTVSKITVINGSGTKVKNYKNEDLAKIEIRSKYLKGSTVVIEYIIEVKNEGDTAGYATEIVDYKPKDLTFNSAENSDWYQKDSYLYSSSLAKTKIEPGQTKKIKLVLSKKMTESNTGLTNNKAEIISSNNLQGIIENSSSKQAKENNLSSADVIISIGTGVGIYLTVTLFITGIISIGILILIKRFLIKRNY